MALEPRRPRSAWRRTWDLCIATLAWPGKQGMGLVPVIAYAAKALVAFLVWRSGSSQDAARVSLTLVAGGPPMTIEMSVVQILLIVGLIIVLFVGMGAVYVRDQGESDRAIHALATPKLTIPDGAQGVAIEDDPRPPGGKIACLVIKNISPTVRVEGAEAQIVSVNPPGKFRPHAPMQWLERITSGTTKTSVDINPGVTARAQIARTQFESGGLRGPADGAWVVRPTHAIAGGMDDRLAPGTYCLQVSVSGGGTRTLKQRVALTVNSDLRDPFTIRLDGPLLIE